MEQYGRNSSSWTDSIEQEVEKVIDDLEKEWGTDDLIELLGECEFALSYNAGRIDQLKAKGLRRLYNVITGINKKNKQIIMDNVQSIQEISLKIQKILMNRIDIVSSAYQSLNDKVDTEIFWTRDIIKKLLRKLKNVSVNAELTRWQVNVRNLRMENGRKYVEASDGVKILLVVSDIFKIVHDQIELAEESLLETTLNDSLEIPSRMRISDFYRDIISDKDCLPLYVKKEYNYSAGDISEYGGKLYNINDFYCDHHIKEIARQSDRTLNDMCMEYYGGTTHEGDKTISPSDLCRRLLEDLIVLDHRHRIEIENMKTQEPPEKPILSKATPPEPSKETIVYSVLRLTPEGCRLFNSGEGNTSRLSSKHGRFKDIQSIQAYINGVKPYLIAAPEKFINDYRHIFPRESKCISLSDYYMYLWFAGMEKSKRANKMVAFIDHYDKDLYFSRYGVKNSGDGYERIYGRKADVYDTRTGNHTVQDVKEGFSKNDVDVEIYMTFLDDTINKRLAKHNVNMVDEKWEKYLETSNDMLGKIIDDMIDKSNDKENNMIKRII